VSAELRVASLRGSTGKEVVSISYRCIAVVAFLACASALASGQTRRAVSVSSNGDAYHCGPAPCVLPPTQVSFGVDAFDAPIAADPTNQERITVGSDNPQCSPNSGLDFFLSGDGGLDWNSFCMSPVFSGNQEYIPDVDPVLGYDRNGAAYIGGFYIDNSGRASFGFEGFQKSSDGVNWSTPKAAVILQDYDPEYCWMAVDDSAASPYVNSVYVSCVMVGPLNRNTSNQVLVAHSNDGGATWQQVNVAPAQLAPDVDRNTAVTVGGDGTVYLSWMFCNSGPYVCDNNKGYMVFSKCSDGGDTWSKPSLISGVTLHGVPNTFIGVPDTPSIAVDNSNGPHSGNLYVVMYNWTGAFMQVVVARSTDGGSTWSKPVPVAPGITHDQFLPWISVSPTGLVGVSWLDRRNDPANIDYQAYAAISTDGGESFQTNVQLTTGFSDPNAMMGSSIGSYTGNTWDGPNYFLAAWMDNSNTEYLQDYVGGIRLK